MADLKQYVKEETNMDSKADRPDITQESLKNQTSSPKNNTSSLPAQLSSDSREEAASGAQPTPFVHTGVPAVPRAGDALPTGALVNGPASHPTSDEPSAPNKGGVSPRKAPPAESAGRLSSPRAPDPPGALRPDALKNAAGPFPDTPPGRPGAIGNRSEALRGGPPSRKSGNEAPTGQTGAGCVTSGRTMWDFQTESSENSSDDCGPGWGPRKRFARRLWIDCRGEEDEEEEGSAKKAETVPLSVSQRWRKRKVDTAEVPGLSPASKTLQSNECPSSNNGVLSFRRKPGLQSSMDSSETVVAIKQLIARAPAKKNFDGNGFSQADGFSLAGGKFMQPKTESSTGSGSEEEPSFFPCTKCNVNFEEKRHLHRHMMYHLDGHNQARHVNAPQPFICKECGRSFRDRGSLLKHMTIHQERREKLMEEIKGLSELQDEGRAAGLQCPQCVFGTSCPKTFVQHAKTHEKDKRRHAAAAEREPETHPRAAHRVACAPRYAPARGTLAFEKNEARVPIFFSCRVCPFSAQSESTLVKHVELAHRQLYASDFERPSYDETNDYTFQPQFPRESQKADSQRLQLSPKFCIQRQAFRKRAELPFWSDLFIKSKSTQKARKGFASSPSRWSLGNSTNKLSPFSRQSDKPSKLSLQPAEKIDVTTGLPYDEDCKNDQEFGSMFSGNAEMPKSILSCYKPLVPKMESSSTYYVGYDSDNGRGDNEEPDSSRLTTPPVTKKSPSKRKMSTPYHNTTDRTTHVILSKHEHAAKRHISEDSCEDTYDFSDYTSEATANFLDCSENEQNPYARSYFIRRQRGPIKKSRGPSADMFERHCEERGRSEIQRFTVKEECVEVALGPPESASGPQMIDSPDFDASLFGAERRSCPYCPAMFESGVGLSNHVRGHLHRVGLSYDARHVVTPEQVASRDRTLRVRKKAPPTSRRIKKEKQESQMEHTCPLCGGWFDTKTGLSNHVRGHLKRIGKTISSTSKSPVCILNEMMKDEEEHQNILQVLNKKRFLSRPFVSQKFASSDGLFLTPTGIPVKIQHAGQDGKPWGPSVPRPDKEGLEKPELAARGPPSSSLIELLEKKKLVEELELKNCSQSIRKHFTMSLPNQSSAGTGVIGWPQEKSEITKKVCLHCNATFPSAVSLSNHLRAYARRKRAALLEGTSYDCKQKKPRSRPGPKKKIFALPHSADEIYRLTCRFCDLVFQGPLSVQEDWIKHLQRHIMNASVPCTGAGMVEVTALPAEPPSTPEETAPPLVPQAAS
ncbi:zinc finger protein 644-like isoform X2 [Anguilla anguilla]|uniref:zinc finger protein 644-like isoform X2 n=1 Tax=Anguilla anguilla TaxID=7936 RepID=UPI0015AE5161|nr:zinc finger protein 644-like isoform X2 [Anguilla anguilla]